MTSPLELNCLVLGQETNNTFQVTLERTRSIAYLKDVIKDKKKPEFDHVSADKLVLSQVSVLVDSELVKSLENAEKNFLHPVNKLGHIFHDEDKYKAGYLHVIVELPLALSITPSAPSNLELNCWVLGDSSNNIFPVKIAANESVGVLKDAIKEKMKPTFDRVPANTLVLWNVSIPHDHSLPTYLSDVVSKRELSAPMDKLSEVFSDLPREKHIHIIVERTTIRSTVDTKRGGEGRRDTVDALRARFESVIAGILKAKGPSDSAKSSVYQKSQIAYSIYDGRYKAGNPRPSVAPPIQLFHPAFGHFLDALSITSPTLDNDMIRETTEFMKAATAIYSDERERTASLTPLLAKILDVRIQTIVNEDKTYADGIVELFVERECTLLLLKEDKNEFGDGGCDPSTQAGLSAARHWAQSKFKMFRDVTCCPTFLIATAGPWIAVLGIVITDIVVVQRLTGCFWLGLDSVHSAPHIEDVARFLSALKLGVKNLDSYYKSPNLSNVSPESRYFPSITAYKDEEKGQMVDFKYVGYLENSFDCVTLRAQTLTEPIKDIVVKFVHQYGDRPHRLLANAGLAPKLLCCESPHFNNEQQPFYRSLTMVVMEYIEGSTLATAKAEMDHDRTEAVKSDIERALKLLHNHQYVFGDLRSPNIMVTKTEQVYRGKLIDFDWAGDKGQAKYPHLISKDIRWPDGVQPLVTIEDVHDLQMFKQLFS